MQCLYIVCYKKEIKLTSLQVYGKETLERTTLKSLGLTSGRAILRLLYRDPEQLKIQAHISAPLVPKPVVVTSDSVSQSDREDRTVPPLSTPHRRSKETSNDATSSTEKISNVGENRENRENSRGKEKTDRRNEGTSTSRSDRHQETSARTRERNQSAATSRASENRDRDRSVAEARARVVQEDVREIQFVRCN